MSKETSCCKCDVLIHPPKPEIIAGLEALPRQMAGFPEYRRALLRSIRAYDPLNDWSAREGDDRGIMLLEMWAYVLDILGFYDERIANETYLRTAVHRSSLRRLVELIGYRPRPGLAAKVVLAALADSHEALLLPAGTGFRSAAFGDEAPQVFETTSDTLVETKRNQWTLAPVRKRSPGRNSLFDVASINLAADQLVLFAWRISFPVSLAPAGRLRVRPGVFSDSSDGRPFITSRLDAGSRVLEKRISSELGRIGRGTDSLEISRVGVEVPSRLAFDKMAVGVVSTIKNVAAQDGSTYARVDVTPPPVFDAGVSVERISVLTPSETASLNGFAAASRRIRHSGQRTTMILDSTYPALTVGNFLIAVRDTELRAGRVTQVQSTTVKLGMASDSPAVPVTQVTIQPRLPSEWSNGIQLHFNMVDGGQLVNPATTHLNRDDVDSAQILPPIDVPELGSPDKFLLHGAEQRGERVGGRLIFDPSDLLGNASISLNDDQPDFISPLRTPVNVYGNLVIATRGESVRNEILGSGNAALSFQELALAKKPLTHIADPTAPNGRRSTLEIRVNGVRWSERQSFFGIDPGAEIYVVKQNDDEESIVTFGDGRTGARLPTGIDNVIATYRYGAGAASPPANAITQLFRPVAGLRRVRNPVAAGGGRDPDRTEDLRDNAPASALTLGRALSLVDFLALAYDFGVLNAHASWAWDNTAQRALVKIWYIADGGDVSKDLRNYLVGQADPNVPLLACEAVAIESRLVVDLEIDQRFDSDSVEGAVISALGDIDTGLFALENIPIGCPLYRSRLFEQILSVDGVLSVRALTVDGRPAPSAITAPEGRYRYFLPRLVVGNSAAGDVLVTKQPRRSRFSLARARVTRSIET